MEWQIQQDAWDSEHAARVTQQCLQTVLKYWQGIMNNATWVSRLDSLPKSEEWCTSFLKASSKTKNSFWIESYTGEDTGCFPSVQITRLFRVLERVDRIHKSWWRTFWAFTYTITQKSSPLAVFALFWTLLVETFLTMSKRLSCHE